MAARPCELIPASGDNDSCPHFRVTKIAASQWTIRLFAMGVSVVARLA